MNALMETNCIYLPYQQTKSFSTIVIDYLQQDEKLRPYFQHSPNIEGIKAAIEARKNFDIDRKLLVEELRKQYHSVTLTPLQEDYLSKLEQENTFTICTAHQPNIFTGHLYFIYKIIHAIKLADTLRLQLPDFTFVPVFYMGSEDADLDELGHISIEGKEYKWETKQTGAVGKMKVDKALISLINEMQGQVAVHPFGNQLIDLFAKCYKEGETIQQATLLLVNELFSELGLLILIPDNAALKRPFNAVVKKEITEGFSFSLVQQTINELSANYKVQAGGRPINLFYLQDDSRERIEKVGDRYVAVNTAEQWSQEELLMEVDKHPERFSANVILRAAFQEMILPNIAFIGGGGELAYWLELKRVFEAVAIPFPVLVLRNSFMLVNEQQMLLANKLGFTITELFASIDELVEAIVKRNNGVKLTLDSERSAFETLYSEVANASVAIDVTLADHVQALQKRHLYQLHELEKKMLRAEKRKYDAQRRQLEKLKQQLFPGGSLQERIDNITAFYARYGKDWLQKLFDASPGLEQQFCIMEIK